MIISYPIPDTSAALSQQVIPKVRIDIHQHEDSGEDMHAFDDIRGNGPYTSPAALSLRPISVVSQRRKNGNASVWNIQRPAGMSTMYTPELEAWEDFHFDLG